MMFKRRGRVAKPASGGWNLAKTAMQLVVFWTMFLYVLPHLVVYVERLLGIMAFGGGIPTAFGVILLVCGSLVGFWSAAVMAIEGRGTPLPLDESNALVVVGPYRFVRNPMALSGSVQVIGVGLIIGSLGTVIATIVGALFWDRVIRPWEEWDMRQRFGAAFDCYEKRVRCWRIRLRGYNASNDVFEPPYSPNQTTWPGAYVVLYDGHCRFCTEASKKLMKLLPEKASERVDFQTTGALDCFPGLTHEACMYRMHLVTPFGHVFTGAEAIAQALKAGSRLGHLAMLYYLPGIRLASDVAYDFIGRHRYKLMGKTADCTDGSCDLHHH